MWRHEAPHVLAALLRRGPALEDCEDAAQEALVAAAEQWPREGMPQNPRGWLVRVASRRLVDAHRATVARVDREVREIREEVPRPVTWSERTGDHDDSLQMLVLCCHPSLSTASAVALTLRAVGGLTTREIAAGLLVPETTAAQRISRAKATLRAGGARFGAVEAAELPLRLHAVRHVLHLVFTTGAAPPSGGDVVNHDLVTEAVRLTERLHRALPRDPETAGLLALMLLVQARAAARTRDGLLVPLAEQDRAVWDQGMIARGVALLEEALPHGPVGPFQLQAAIAAVHATAPSLASTDWAQIHELYRMLLAVAPSPAAELGAAIALSELDGPAAGLVALQPLLAARPRDHRVLAAMAHLLDAQGSPEAADTYQRAAALTDSVPEQRYLNARARHSRR
ncbi:RNA polymerase sigma factor (sigma-70 family) [Nocardioides ginsengisegetis]|uniref:RNA polymerase sigma factor (Sigma-70 family) n=1 Tax=Nocardioides ginsengisegetis TaxID=661491 RepID=A0A7W3PAR9_9ACTN|nr:RNA polymerase sigma factor (sigma-70 family) [Nocardioides ginsengisegetis]